MPFLRVGFVGFLNCGYGFLGFYVGCFVSALFSFWVMGASGDGRCLLLWFTPVIQETEVQRVFLAHSRSGRW